MRRYDGLIRNGGAAADGGEYEEKRFPSQGRKGLFRHMPAEWAIAVVHCAALWCTAS